MSAIDIHNLSFSIEGKAILHQLEFSIQPGEFFFLLGPSGSGKTTLLRIMAGFYQPTAGELSINSKKMKDIPPQKRNIGMMFQSYALFPHMSVGENIGYGLKLRHLTRTQRDEKIKQVLELVGLSGYASRLPGTLSGGEQQRVALARALVIEPELLLLDEPLSNLDAQLRLRMRKELREIQQKTGITAVYVTHDQDEALSMADRIAILKDGKILQIGTPREVYYHPADPFVANFIGKANLFTGQMRNHLIASPFGDLTITNAIQLPKESAPVVFCIRPESVMVLEPGETAVDNQFSGLIKDLRFFGESMELYIQLASNDILHAIISNPRQWDYQIGQPIRFRIPSQEIIVLEK